MTKIINLENLCREVCTIARDGALFLRTESLQFDRNKVEEKSAHNYVSYVDKESEKRLVERLTTLLPEAGFITEEETVEDIKKDWMWIVDPLDGTTNFIHNLTPYCISIALAYKGEVYVGVVYEVTREECFYAWKDGGAYLNGQKIQVTSIDSINKSLLLMGLPYNDKGFKSMALHMIQRFYGYAGGARLLGASATELCYIACGRAEFRIEAFLGMWDVAAGGLILQEAGGKISDFKGGERWLTGDEVVATNGLLHDEVLKIVREVNWDSENQGK